MTIKIRNLDTFCNVTNHFLMYNALKNVFYVIKMLNKSFKQQTGL